MVKTPTVRKCQSRQIFELQCDALITYSLPGKYIYCENTGNYPAGKKRVKSKFPALL
jgi:hypothetical protein